MSDLRYARIVCEECGEQYLSEAEYLKQLRDADRGWRCPSCRCYPCDFDDAYFEEHHGVSTLEELGG